MCLLLPRKRRRRIENSPILTVLTPFQKRESVSRADFNLIFSGFRDSIPYFYPYSMTLVTVYMQICLGISEHTKGTLELANKNPGAKSIFFTQTSLNTYSSCKKIVRRRKRRKTSFYPPWSLVCMHIRSPLLSIPNLSSSTS